MLARLNTAIKNLETMIKATQTATVAVDQITAIFDSDLDTEHLPPLPEVIENLPENDLNTAIEKAKQVYAEAMQEEKKVVTTDVQARYAAALTQAEALKSANSTLQLKTGEALVNSSSRMLALLRSGDSKEFAKRPPKPDMKSEASLPAPTDDEIAAQRKKVKDLSAQLQELGEKLQSFQQVTHPEYAGAVRVISSMLVGAIKIKAKECEVAALKELELTYRLVKANGARLAVEATSSPTARAAYGSFRPVSVTSTTRASDSQQTPAQSYRPGFPSRTM